MAPDPRCHFPPLGSHVGKPCPYCGAAMEKPGGSRPLGVTREHVVPRIRGGELIPGNRLIVCWGCNQDKANRTLQEWINKLRINGDPRLLLVEAVRKSLEGTCTVQEAAIHTASPLAFGPATSLET